MNWWQALLLSSIVAVVSGYQRQPLSIIRWQQQQRTTAISRQWNDDSNAIRRTATAHQMMSIEDNDESTSLATFLESPILSIGAGVGGIVLLLINRLGLGFDIISDVQSRADIIAVIGCSALLLNVLSEQDITARNRDPVPLVGFALKSPLIAEDLNPKLKVAVEWCVNTILQTTPVTSVHVISPASTVWGRGGVVGQGDDRTTSSLKGIDKMPILQKTLKLSEEVYLPDLQILPGKVEFSYLPINVQSVLLLPLPNGGAVAMGTNQAKVLKVKDLNRIRSCVAIFRSFL
jgi:hypothetical protein